ncbi:D-mandelate dehydrogenase [Meredithblackwellia eburnea MCA 4105]
MITKISPPSILLLGSPPAHQDKLWAEFQQHYNIVPVTSASRAEFIESLKSGQFGDFSGILKPAVHEGNVAHPWNEEIISLLPSSCKIFSAAGAGYDYLNVPFLRSRGIRFTNCRGAGDTATSDLALFLILATFRLTSYSEWAARTGDPEIFNKVHVEVGLKAVNPKGRVLGALGLGAIQKEIVRKAGFAGLGLKVIYYDPFRSPKEVEDSLQVEYVSSKEELARRSDCVSVSVPYMESTHHLVDAAFISNMKQGARLVNSSRGRTVDEAALIDALKSGHLLSAGLDVHYNEPQVSPELIKLRNVTLLSHIGGVAQDTFEEFDRLCLTNLDNHLRLEKDLLTEVFQ